jgi:membrane fusion protein (multidrug efflux system)
MVSMPRDRSEKNDHDDSTDEGSGQPSGEHRRPHSDQPSHHHTKTSTGQKHGDSKAGDSKTKEKKPSILHNRLFQIGAGILVLILLIAAFIWWRIARQYEKTDDAFIDAHIVHVAPQIAGRITAVLVDDNQTVTAGQPLAEIDSDEAQARLSQIQAQLAQAQTQYEQASALERGAAAQAENAEREYGRYRNLKKSAPAAVAQQQIDQAAAVARNATAQHEAATAQVAGALAQIKVYRAQIAAADLTLKYTHVVAPEAGHIAQRSVAVGNYVSPGQDMMTIVPSQLWVTANFKETQLARMRVGQSATVTVDACGKTDVPGHVDSIQRGAGQAFGILPPENATGNFVKVVQRVPVKIVLDQVPANCTLGPGMSVEPRVKVR